MKGIIIGIFLLMELFGFLLEYLNFKNRNAPLPKNVKDVYDAETYKKHKAYEMDNLKLQIISGISGLGISLAVLGFNLHSFFFYLLGIEGLYLRVYFMFVMVALISLPLGILFGAIKTFKIEAKYGFNKSTVGTFIADIIKQQVILGIVVLGLISLFMLLHSAIGNMVFVIFFFVLAAVMLFIAFFMHFFSKLFNKFTPIEEGTLKEKIDALSAKTDFPVKKVFSMNASKRSTKMNAYFAGFGRNRVIVLYDTLIEKMTEDEVISVLAHEIGHAKKRHVLFSMPMSFIQFAILLLAGFFVVNVGDISMAFGFTELNIAFNIFVLMIFASPILTLCQIPFSAVRRKFEYAADAFEVKHAGVDTAVSALKKLYKEDYGNLTPHPFVVLIRHSHPTLTQRISAMEAVVAKQ
ncbi:MAG: M48 family metallopeptidase [Defluviitaleaceae bacterium]|nr:M48 family metallopeptidase [Defluviitaleaceae bacterium]